MRAAKLIIAGVAVILIAAAALVSLRKPIAEILLRQAMTAQGMHNPEARVTEFTVNHFRIEDLSAARTGAAPDERLSLARIDVKFDLREAIIKRRVKAVKIGPGEVGLRIDDTGAMEIAGRTVGGGEGEAGALPFDALTLSGLQVYAVTPHGAASGSIEAAYDVETGGEATINLASGAAGLRGVVFKNAGLDAAIALAAGGAVDVVMNYAGDIQSPYGAFRGAEFEIAGEGSSWRDIARGDWRAFRGAMTMSARDVLLDRNGAPYGDILNRFSSALGGPVETLRVSGEVLAVIDENGFAMRIGERPVAFAADNGAQLILDAALDDPLLVYRDGQAAVEGALSLRGENISAAARLDARQSGAGWDFDAPVNVSKLDLPNIKATDLSAVLRGTAGENEVNFEATASGAVKRVAIGRFSVVDAPGALSVRGVYDREKQTAEIYLPTDNCGALERLSFSIAGQDMNAALKDARLCSSRAPLAVIRLGDNPVTEFSGVVTAQSGTYRLGRTRFAGAPPSIEIAGKYTPLENSTRASGSAKGGSVVLNDLLRFDRADAAFDFALDKDAMIIGVKASSVRMTEYAQTVKVAPIFGKGSLTLAGGVARFDYRAFTGDGDALGAGAGKHNIGTAAGEAAFTFNRLQFAPGGLQPDKLAPVLKGIIGLSRGAAEGAAQFSWTPRGITSRAQLSFDDFTFAGPGLTVTRTIGVNGDLAFSNLWPVATDGAQSVTVDGVDFGALQLESGEIVFEMPGDETLIVERAIFPWFGGEIGVRNSTASFAGGNALAALHVQSIDIKQILDFVDVEGLSGEGVLTGELPLVIKDSRASFVDGRLTAEGPGRISYVGKAGAAAAEAGGEAQIAFDILRDLRYESLSVLVDGPLDGQLDFRIKFEGTGEVSVNRARGRVPVKYNINLETALLDLLRQANLSRDFELLIRRADDGDKENAELP